MVRKPSWPLSRCCATILGGTGAPARTPVISRSAVHARPYPGGFLMASNICSCHVYALHTYTTVSRCSSILTQGLSHNSGQHRLVFVPMCEKLHFEEHYRPHCQSTTVTSVAAGTLLVHLLSSMSVLTLESEKKGLLQKRQMWAESPGRCSLRSIKKLELQTPLSSWWTSEFWESSELIRISLWIKTVLGCPSQGEIPFVGSHLEKNKL